MERRGWTVRIWGSVIGAICTAIFLGCGSSSSQPIYYGKLVPVNGTLTLDGNPVSEATVSFSPADGKAIEGFSSAAGITDTSGKYQLQTGTKIGVPPGRYRVSIERWATPDGKPFKEDPANGIDAVQAQMSGQLKQLIPEKYNDPGKAQISVTVLEEMKEPVNLELKSK